MLVKIGAFLKKYIILSVAIGIVFVIVLIGGFFFLNNGIFNKFEETNQCVVRFESNGGTSIEEAIVLCGGVVEKPNNPEKT